MTDFYLVRIIANNSDKLFIIFLLLISSLLIRQSIIIAKQNWVKTKTHTITIFLLPLITHVITSVISNNIALSLGMVGALSIVRFRNPVKSPFELSIYFLLITLGITASTNFKWLILLVLFSIMVIIGIEVYCKIYFYLFKKDFFLNSFTESNSLSILEISSKKQFESLKKNEFLVSFDEKNNNFTYRFSSNNPENLIRLEKDIKKTNPNVESHYSKF